LFRGIALWLIFLDHIHSNLVAWATIRNYGFSDATEIFVFVSGYTATFVYGKEMRLRRWRTLPRPRTHRASIAALLRPLFFLVVVGLLLLLLLHNRPRFNGCRRRRANICAFVLLLFRKPQPGLRLLHQGVS
jgi:hypothetical protein